MSAPLGRRRRPSGLALVDEQHRAFVRRRLRGLGVMESDVDDAVQDVFEVLLRRIADYDPRFPVSGWLSGIARRVARRYRERGRRVVVPLDDERATFEASAEEQVARCEALATLREFLGELDPDRWEVFVLSEVEGLRGSEIAAELGVNQNTVYARLRSARAAFERKLAEGRPQPRGRAWLVLPPWLFRRPSMGVVTPILATITVAISITLGASLGRCGREPKAGEGERSERSISEPASPGTPPLDLAVGPPRTAEPNGPAVVDTSPAQALQAVPDADGWYAMGSGESMRSGPTGLEQVLGWEGRYRLVDDRVELELTYFGDHGKAPEHAQGLLELERMTIVDGQPAWSEMIEVGGSHMLHWVLRATQPGRVGFSLRVGDPEGGGVTNGIVLISDRGRLRPCAAAECDAPAADDTEFLSDDMITVNVANRCNEPVQFVLYAGFPEHRPPPGIRVYTLDADEQTQMTVDSAQWFLHRDEAGAYSGGGRTDEDGAWVRFLAVDGRCSGISTLSDDAQDWSEL